MSEIQVEIIEIEGKQYKRVSENGDEFWCLRTIAQQCEVQYETIRYHLRDKRVIFDPFIRSYKVFLDIEKKRDQLFLQVPEGLDQLRLYVRKLKNNPEMNKIMSFISSMRKGEIIAAKKEDIDSLKEKMLAGVLEKLGSTLERMNHNQLTLVDDVQKLKGEQTFDSQRANIIQSLIYRYSRKHELPIKTVWNGFKQAFGITGYRNAELKYFVPFVEYFFALDKYIVAAVFNDYKEKQYKDSGIMRDLLAVLEGEPRAVSDLDKYT